MYVNQHTFEEKYKNFGMNEVWCPHCHVVGVTDEGMDALQALRTAMGVPLTVNSAYRCPDHNRAVGGAKRSKHVEGHAFDISIRKLPKWKLLKLAKEVGFKGFGFYNSFLHVDLGPTRSWGRWG